GQIINTEQFNFITRLDNAPTPEARTRVINEDPQLTARVFIFILNRISKEQTLQYILTLLDDILQVFMLEFIHNLLKEDKLRVETFCSCFQDSREAIWPHFFSFFQRGDPFCMYQASRIVAKFACWSRQLMEEKELMYYLNWLRDQLLIPKNEYDQTVARNLQMMLRIPKYRARYAEVGGAFKYWISDRTVALLKSLRNIPAGPEHNLMRRIIKLQFKVSVRAAREVWWTQKAKEVEEAQKASNARRFFQLIRATGPRKVPVSETIKDWKGLTSLSKGERPHRRYPGMVIRKKSFSCNTFPVPSCHATRRKHEGWATTRLPKPRQEKSRGRGRVRTTDLPVVCSVCKSLVLMYPRGNKVARRTSRGSVQTTKHDDTTMGTCNSHLFITAVIGTIIDLPASNCGLVSEAVRDRSLKDYAKNGVVARSIVIATDDCLAPLTMQGLPSTPESLCIVEMGVGEPSGPTDENENETLPATGILYLNIGLINGVLLRVILDPVTGELSDTRTRYLGTRPVKLFRIMMQGGEAVLSVSSRSWLSYAYQNRFHLIPLSYEALEYASGFSSEQCPEGIVAICNNSLRIMALEKLGAVFNQTSYPLQYTPRKMVFHPDSNIAYIIETDHNAYTDEVKELRKRQMSEKMIASAAGGTSEEIQLAKESAAAFLEENLPENVFGAPKAGPGMWASLLRCLNPLDGTTSHLIRFPQNEAAHALSLVRFLNRPGELFLVVALVKGLNLSPRSCSGGCLRTYRVWNNGDHLEFIHETLVDDFPAAVCAFQGRLLVGVGKRLRIYDMGRKKLLKKCENKHIPNLITGIYAIGSRIIVTDVQESAFWLRYRPRSENQLVIFADDANPRWITHLAVLDPSTVAISDKFGNVIILRLPNGVIDDIEEDPSGNRALWDRGFLGGASQKAEVLCHFYVGEVVTTLQRATLIPGGSEGIVYATLSGGLGMLVPFSSRDAYDFFQHLELHMRSEGFASNICMSSSDDILRHLEMNLKPRRPVYLAALNVLTLKQNVIDGDLCEIFNSLDPAKQRSIAEEMDKVPSDIAKRLEDIRTRFAF
ncbi:splicing factor 3B subunit 3, partial [Clonorchis sinensis]